MAQTAAERQAAFRKRRDERSESMRIALTKIIAMRGDSVDPIDMEICTTARIGLGEVK